ncbi:hypothetical protein Glove_48g102 [Diversispora epigaea]|uniref:Uncharacterized protein n=1 Tax=Diversispora epigaea TaxID=1348612 RepID=A0A397JGE6_9GLOM|nr:hypothetical protein Glove_48g102 [Diversispora epigaea]
MSSNDMYIFWGAPKDNVLTYPKNITTNRVLIIVASYGITIIIVPSGYVAPFCHDAKLFQNSYKIYIFSDFLEDLQQITSNDYSKEQIDDRLMKLVGRNHELLISEKQIHCEQDLFAVSVSGTYSRGAI